MTPASLPPLITTLLFAFMGWVVYQRNPSSSKNKIYALWCLNTVYWQLSWTVLFNTTSLPLVQVLIKLGYTGIIFLPITFCYLIATYIEEDQAKQQLRYAYGIAAFFAVSVWVEPFFLRGYYHFTWGYYPKAGYLHPVYLTFLTYLVCRGLILLAKKFRAPNISATERSRIRYMLIALTVYVVASIDFLVNYGLPVYPFGFLFTLLSAFIVSYAIIHHQLLDIRLVLRDSTLHLTTAGLLAGTSLAVALSVVILNPYVGVVIGVAMMGLLMAFAYDPIRKAIQPAIDRVMFANQFGYLEELSQLPNDMLEFTNLNEMLKFLVTRLKEAAKLERVRIFMYDPGHQSYVETMGQAAEGETNKEEARQLAETEPLVQLLRSDSKLWTQEDFGKQEHQEAQEQLKSLEGAACFPVNKEKDLLGVVVLGKKTSGELFNQKDTKILQALRLRLENFLGQAMVITQEALNMVKDSHDMKNDINALKGRITWRAMRVAGWQMDLEKQMKILEVERDPERLHAGVNALKAQALEWFQDAEKSRGIENDAVQRLAHRLRNWAEYGRVISEGFRGSRTKEAIEVGQAAKISVERWLPHAEKKGLTLSLQTAPNLLVWGERSLVEQIIENLIDNAIKATKEGDVEVLCKADRSGILLEVKDSGCGMPPEALATIFEKPFYQGRGRETLEQSTGVGLYLVAQYARSLGGKVWAESEVEKGSSFFVQLPKYNQEGERSGAAA